MTILNIATDISVEDDSVKIWIEKNIIYFEYKENIIVNLEIQKKNIEDRVRLSKGIPRYVLSDCRYVKYWTKEAKEYSMTEESQRLIKAIAIILKSSVQCILWNWAVMFFRPKFPTKVFSGKEGALAWLTKIEKADSAYLRI